MDVGPGMGEDEAGEAIGERRLADALRSADQPGMVHARPAIGVEQLPLRIPVADEDGALARMRRTVEPVCGILLDHEATRRGASAKRSTTMS